MTAVQLKKTYKNFSYLSSLKIENIFLNYSELKKQNCDFLEWKFNKVKNIANNYTEHYNSVLIEAQELLDNAYRLRNKQFHGRKNNQLENMSGFLYDIVNDAIAFYIDFLDVYKDDNPNLDSLHNSIRNIRNIKISHLEICENEIKKICVLYDSIRKI